MSKHVVSTAKIPQGTAIYRRGGLPRFLSILLLILFLPASVVGLPVRYCVEQADHASSNRAHAGHGSRAYAEARSSGNLPLLSPSIVHVIVSHCDDALLFLTPSKIQTCGAPKLDSKAMAQGNKSHFLMRRLTDGAWFVAVHGGRDPRLVTLRTVVLLN